MEIILEIIIELIVQLFLELGVNSFISNFRKKNKNKITENKKINLVYAYFGIIFMGAILGFFSSLFFPTRLLSFHPINGISLVISPLILGTFMYFFGIWRKNKNKEISILATFWGGVIFSFSFALVRWLMVVKF